VGGFVTVSIKSILSIPLSPRLSAPCPIFG
jgi:hypothetical protein